MVGPGMAYGSQGYMNRRPGVGWDDYSGMIQEDLQQQMMGRRQQGMNEQGRMLGQGGRMMYQRGSGAPPPPRGYTTTWTAGGSPGALGQGFEGVPMPPMDGPSMYAQQASAPPAMMGSSMAGAGGAAPHGLTLQGAAGQVAGPFAMAMNAFQGAQSGRGYEQAAAQVDQLHPDDQRGARKDIQKAATQEAINRMRSGAVSGSVFGPIGTAVGAIGGAYGGFKGGASAVGKREMLSGMAAEAGKQQAAVAAASMGMSVAGPAASMYAGIKKLRDLF